MLTTLLVASFLVPPSLTEKGYFGVRSITHADNVACVMPESRDIFAEHSHASIFSHEENSEIHLFDEEFADSLQADQTFRFEPSSIPNKIDAVRAELMGYAVLADGWNGPGSLAPKLGNLTAAADWLQKLPAGVPYPRPMVGPSGNVGLYWDEPNGYAELSFEHQDDAAFFATNRKGVQHFFEGYAEIQAAEASIFEVLTQLDSDRLLII